MKAWRGMLVKDFRLILPLFLGGLMLLTAIDLWATLAIDNRTLRIFITLIKAGLYLIAFFPMYFYISLRSEGDKMHQWLHTPRPTWQLLLSKLFVGIPLFFLSLVVSGLYPSWMIFNHFDLFGTTALNPLSLCADIALVLTKTFGTSLIIGVFVMTVWTAFHWIRSYVGKWAWPIIVLGTLALLYSFGRFILTPMAEFLMQWGPIIQGSALLQEVLKGKPTIYTGEILMALLLTLLLFALSSTILNRLEVRR